MNQLYVKFKHCQKSLRSGAIPILHSQRYKRKCYSTPGPNLNKMPIFLPTLTQMNANAFTHFEMEYTNVCSRACISMLLFYHSISESYPHNLVEDITQINFIFRRQSSGDTGLLKEQGTVLNVQQKYTFFECKETKNLENHRSED